MNKKKLTAIAACGVLYLVIVLLARRPLNHIWTLVWAAGYSLVIAAALSVMSIAFEKYRLAISVIVGFITGILLGEVFGKIGMSEPHHFGGLVFQIVFILSLIIGTIIEVRAGLLRNNR